MVENLEPGTNSASIIVVNASRNMQAWVKANELSETEKATHEAIKAMEGKGRDGKGMEWKGRRRRWFNDSREQSFLESNRKGGGKVMETTTTMVTPMCVMQTQ